MNLYTILINKEHPIPEDYLSLVELIPVYGINNQDVLVERRTFAAYEELAAYVREKENVTIGVGNGYRSLEMQQQIYERFCVVYGKDYADAIVAPVGKSEHHMGICIDLNFYFEGEGFISNNDNFDRVRAVFEKHVHPHLSKFGFILRYPLGKEEITGYPYEPWHIRYVGCKAAQQMAQRGLTMEQWKCGPEQ